MRKLFKTAIFGLTALALSFGAAAASQVNAAGSPTSDTIDTSLEYQLNEDGSAIRYISTMVLNGKTLDDITSIDMTFTITSGENSKEAVRSTTTVYESVLGTKEKVDGTYYAVFKITDLTANFTGWTLTPKFTYNYADSTIEDVTATPWTIGYERLYFINTFGWSTLNAYMYGANGANGDWPGQAMTVADSEHGVYYYDYLESSNFTTVIFNNGSGEGTVQTENTTLTGNPTYYLDHTVGKNTSGKFEALSTSTTSFNWALEADAKVHYYQEATSGARSLITDHNETMTETATSGVYECAECGYKGSIDENIIYFEDNYNYGGMKIHYWGGDNATNWPGIDMTYYTTKGDGTKIYYANINTSTGFKFTTDGNFQTADITRSEVGNAFYFNGNWTVGHYYLYGNEVTE